MTTADRRRTRIQGTRRRSRQAELKAARRRAAFAKRVLGVAGSALFAGAVAMARHSYAGHHKRPATPLSAPPGFVAIVRRNLLHAGVVTPAQAPPAATTSVS